PGQGVKSNLTPGSNCGGSTNETTPIGIAHLFLTSLRLGSKAHPQRREPHAELISEGLRLFPGRKVAALGELVEVDEILVGALGPTPRSLVDFLREDTYGSRNGDVVVVEEGAFVFHIETSAGHARVRQPGEGDVVEDVVPCEVAVGSPSR